MALRHWITSLAMVAVTAAPALAQDNSNHQRRDDRQSQQAEQPRREQPQPARQTPAQARQNERAVPRTVAPQREERAVPRTVAPQREAVQQREQTQRRNDARPQYNGNRAVPEHDHGVAVAGPQYDGRRYDGHYDGHDDGHDGHYDGHYDGRYVEPRHYVFASPRIIRPTVIQVLPYRPYVYRPSWSIGVFYGSGGYYPYGYTPDGYFNPIPGHYYGGLRITGAPRQARVFADGYFVGIVDDFDGIFQHMNLEAGPHHIEIQMDGYAPLAFDVNIRPGETITFRADASFFQPY